MEFQIAGIHLHTRACSPCSRLCWCGERRTNRCWDSSPISHQCVQGKKSPGYWGMPWRRQRARWSQKTFVRDHEAREQSQSDISCAAVSLSPFLVTKHDHRGRSRGWLKQLRARCLTGETVNSIHLYTLWSVSRICHRKFVHIPFAEVRSGWENTTQSFDTLIS